MKKISINTVRSFLKENTALSAGFIERDFCVQESSFTVRIKTRLSLPEKTTFINRVLNGCFDSSQNFRPEYLSPMLRATLLQVCTDIPTIPQRGDKDDDGGSIMDIDAMSNLYIAMDLDNLNDRDYQIMLNEIVQLCHHAVDWKRAKVLSGGSDAFKELGDAARLVKNFITSMSEKLDGVDYEALTKLAEAVAYPTDNVNTANVLSNLVNLKDHLPNIESE
ncbi:hypothetical protein D5272_01370 [bacterium D16-76]|nr:hypothetical protein [bacterium D16-76]